MSAFVQWVKSLATPGSAFLAPTTFVRAVLTFIIVGVYMRMQWHAPEPGQLQVPALLVSATSTVTGFYLTSDASATMKAVLSIIYVAAFAAMLFVYGWVPEAINGQVGIVLGIYFGKRITEVQKS